MLSFATVALIIPALFFHASADGKQKPSAKGSSAVLVVEQATGKDVAIGFLPYCSDESWQQFATWAKKTKFSRVRFDKPVEIKFTNGIFQTDTGIRVSVTKDEKLKLEYKDRTILGDDPCQLMTEFTKPRGISRADFLVASAHAEDLIQESPHPVEYLNYSAAAASGAMAIRSGFKAVKATNPRLRAFNRFAAVGGLFLSVWNLDYGLASTMTRKEYAEVLNSDFTLTCSKNSMTVSSGEKRILVDISGGEMQMRLVGLSSIQSDSKSYPAVKSRAFLASLKEDCHSASDAKRIMIELERAREGAKQKIADFDDMPIELQKAGPHVN